MDLFVVVVRSFWSELFLSIVRGDYCKTLSFLGVIFLTKSLMES